MSRNASSAKALAQQRKSRRKWLTFIRMFKYGVSNFSRNAWLTIAATAVMTITLLVIFITFVAQNVLADTATEVAKRIDRSIYLESETTAKQAQPIIDDIKKLDNVQAATFISSADAREEFALSNKQNTNTLDAINEATNKLPATIRIALEDPNDTASLVAYVESSETLKKYIHSTRKPSFIGERKTATSTIARWTELAQKVGIAASVVFVGISSLIIFNTIRMAIFNRREEIQMMKLIGADKSFIRGPFVVEAVAYGFIAAIIATALGLALMVSVADKLQENGVAIAPTSGAMMTYSILVLLAMIGVGALIGIISSLLATRRYLKI